ncbi:MAG: hypothetical protein WDZ93_04010 [Candidatus Paceibacterota bacterium]
MKPLLISLSVLSLVLPAGVFAQTVESRVDIIIEADTTAPVFYRGRHEPSVGSDVRAIAAVSGMAGSEQAAYRWELNGNLLPQTGQVIQFPAPLGNDFLIRVDVRDAAGRDVGNDEQYVSQSEPLVAFYEQNLLRGISRIAVGDTHLFTGDETNVRAEPFFMSADILSDPHELLWRVDGSRHTGGEGDPLMLTLRRTGGSGQILIEFSLRSGSAFGQYVKDRFSLTF